MSPPITTGFIAYISPAYDNSTEIASFKNLDCFANGSQRQTEAFLGRLRSVDGIPTECRLRERQRCDPESQPVIPVAETIGCARCFLQKLLKFWFKFTN